MKALVKKYNQAGLHLEDVPLRTCGLNDVKIKITHTSICGTDLHIYNWDDWAKRTLKTPLIIGHEFCGVIDEIGSQVKQFKEGDRVSGEGHITCNNCRNCQAGKKHLCPSTIGIGVNCDGAFAEYLIMPESNIWPVDDNISSEVASFFDPLGNAVHAALSHEIIGEDVLITGAGPIGLMSIKICQTMGARNIVITDTNEYRLKLAKKLGVSAAINVKNQKIKDYYKNLKIVNGFDVGLEMSGNPNALNDMLISMYHGGRISLLGLLPENTPINWDLVIFKGLILKGIYGRKIYETWYKMTQMLKNGLDVSKIITHKISVNNFEEGFKIMNSKKCGKVVMKW
tara:strand:- start:9 stop:1031 length:1023 start_codon:yes stop_codon:yes gene_type:complete